MTEAEAATDEPGDEQVTFTQNFRSLGTEYRATLYRNLRFTVYRRNEAHPVIDIFALPSGVEMFCNEFTIEQRTVVLDILMRAYRRGYDEGRR